MRIFGIDPGSVRTGYGCVETDGSRHHLVVSGALSTTAVSTLPEKLYAIHHGLTELFARCRPDAVAIENLFHASNARSALRLGHARGVAMLAACQAGLPVSEYTPTQIKRAVVGYGRGEKHQVQRMVQLILGLAALPTPHDAADALAVAICHAHTVGAPQAAGIGTAGLVASATAAARRPAAMPKAATSWRHYRPSQP